MPSNLRQVGASAEDRAADYLVSQGYTVITRRRKMPHGELDLVALDGEILVFVEVKFRHVGSPEESVGATKMRNWQRAAETYRIEMGEQQRKVRYDLIAIDGDGLRHHLNIADF